MATLETEWEKACKGSHKSIVSYFDIHKEEILSSGSSSFLAGLITSDDIKSLQHIFQNSNPNQYINVIPTNKYRDHPLWHAMSSTFAVIRCVVSNGAKFPNDIGSGFIHQFLAYNRKMTPDEIYLCVDYLLTNLTVKINGGNIMRLLADGCARCGYNNNKLPFDTIKMANLIKRKRPDFQKQFGYGIYIGIAVGEQRFEFAEFMIENGANLTVDLYVKTDVFSEPNDAIIKWLSEHDVDINKEMKDFTRTPLFQCCIDQRYDLMELLINNGADIHKKCKYNDTMISSLQLCQQTFPPKHFEYFRNYNAKTIVFDIDFSKIPKTVPPLNFVFDDEKSLNDINNKCINKRKEIMDLENELAVKYGELRDLVCEQSEIEKKKQNIVLWNEMNEEWMHFLNEWQKWDSLCFVEYLKRSKYDKKAYDSYFLSDSIAIQKIENYVKDNLNTFTEEKNADQNDETYFKGIYLNQFDKSSIYGVGITESEDIQSVYQSLQQLTKSKMNIAQKEHYKVNPSKIEKLKEWLTNIVKLPQYFDVFVANDIYLDLMGSVTKDDLKDMGIKSVGHLRTILNHSSQLQQQNGDKEGDVYSTDYI